MSKVWIVNLILFLVIIFAALIIGLGYLINLFKSLEFREPVPQIAIEAPIVETPSIEIIEEAESIFGYTYDGESVPGENERVDLTKAFIVTNPNEYPIIVDEIKTNIFDSSGKNLDFTSDYLFFALENRIIAPGETVHFAAISNVPKLHFREDYGYSESELIVYKASEHKVPYTNLEVEHVDYQFEDSESGNKKLVVRTHLFNNTSTNVDTTELVFVILLYDHNGKLIGGDSQISTAYEPERIRPNEQKSLYLTIRI